MQFVPGNIYHIYNQGNNRQPIFIHPGDYLIFLTLYKRLIATVADTIAWCLMPNHFHFMIHTDQRCNAIIKQGGNNLDPVTNGFRKILSGYARIFNNQNQRTGSVFRQKTKSKCLSDIPVKPESDLNIRDYFVNCFHYIHQNPLSAGLVNKMEDWHYSSFLDYAMLRNGTLCKKELASVFCQYNPGSFIVDSYKKIDEKLSGEFLN